MLLSFFFHFKFSGGAKCHHYDNVGLPSHSWTSFTRKHETFLFFTGTENEGKNVVGLSRLYVFAAAPFESSPFPLAAERTRRKDPLDGFNKYIYGWNITSSDYWAVSSSNLYSFVLWWWFCSVLRTVFR